MSLRHLKHILDACERADAPPTMRHALAVVAFYADADGSMSGGTGFLARMTGLYRRTVERAMAGAKRRGLVKIHRRGKRGGTWQTTIYTVPGGSGPVTLGVAVLSAKGSGRAPHSLKRQTCGGSASPDGGASAFNTTSSRKPTKQLRELSRYEP